MDYRNVSCANNGMKARVAYLVEDAGRGYADLDGADGDATMVN